MNKKVGILIGGIVILLVSTLLYLKVNAPLDIRGIGSNVEQAGNNTNGKGNSFVIVVNPENNGFGKIRLKEVLINSNEKPDKVELGVGRSNYMVMVTHALGNIDEHEDISFHEIGKHPIKPVSAVQSEEMDSDTIKQYGIAVTHDERINNLVVKYCYLGIPFELKLDLKEE